jgi:hypothetical protein
MRIINSHVHMIDLEGMMKKYPGLGMPEGVAALSKIEALAMPLLRPGALLAQMDEAGIEKTVLYAVEAPIVYASNEYVAALCRAYPDRLTGFASVDPKRETALDELKRAVEDLGLKGIKFHPPLQNFFPNDKKVYPIYEWAQTLGLPVVFHIGTTPFGAMCRLSQADPLLLDDVAVDFPRLKIILTHLGTLWQNEAFMVVEKNPNVYIDTAAYLYEIETLLDDHLVSRLGEDKIIFGTDYPMPSEGRMHRMKDFVECVKALKLPEKVKEKIFSENLAKLIDL